MQVGTSTATSTAQTMRPVTRPPHLLSHAGRQLVIRPAGRYMAKTAITREDHGCAIMYRRTHPPRA
eukprot:15300-Eustigmatos_ZCMA.PRE.1